jgi:hypothetical protein
VHLPLAFSIHHFVSSVGADAGFAAIVGLAILVLLYFAQARETSSLRDQSVSASERVAELERRLAALGSSAVKPLARAASGQGSRVTALIPSAPAGVAAPALAAATRVIPLPKPTGLPSLAPAAAPAAMAPVAAAAAPPSVTLPPAGVTPPPSVTLPPAGVTPPPATVAASSGAAPPIATPPPIPAAPSTSTNGTGEHTIGRAAATAGAIGGDRRRVQIRPGASFTPPPRSPLRPGARGIGSRRWLPAVVGLVLAVVAVAALLIVTSTGGSPRPAASSRTTNAITPKPKTVFNPASVTVAVLNGTDVSLLAHRVALKLQHVGYKQGTVATASDQTHTTTLVGYLSGHRHAATEVAHALGLAPSAVAPADQSAQAVACPPSAACTADVIVTVGTDLSNTP